MTWLKKMATVGIGLNTGAFVFLWLAAWGLNAVEGTHFDLDRLKELFIWVMGYLNTTHLINSKWNSPPGEMPGAETRTGAAPAAASPVKAEGGVAK